MRLMITRPRDDALPLAAALAGLGIEALIEPLMRVAPCRAAPFSLGDWQALLVTSANGVRALAVATGRRDVAVYAVGAASAQVARAAGFTTVVTAGGDVDSLAAVVRARLRPEDGPLLHVSGTEVAGDLAGRLAADGFACDRRVLYRAVAVDRLSAAATTALAAGDVDGVVLYSPRTARLFTALARAAGVSHACAGMTAYCLSAAVASAAADGLDWRRLVTAAKPDQPSMLAALAEASTNPHLVSPPQGLP